MFTGECFTRRVKSQVADSVKIFQSMLIINSLIFINRPRFWLAVLCTRAVLDLGEVALIHRQGLSNKPYVGPGRLRSGVLATSRGALKGVMLRLDRSVARITLGSDRAIADKLVTVN